MTIIVKRLIIWLIIVITPFLLLTGIIYYQFKIDNSVLSIENESLRGKKIELQTLLDINGEVAELNFDTEVAVINFWYKECVHCLQAMSQHDSLLTKSHGQYTLISINTDNLSTFQQLLSKDSKFEFLQNRINNWQHYCLSTGKVHPHQVLNDLYGISYYPAYIVINRDLEIINMPQNSIIYINNNFINKFPFWHTTFKQFKINEGLKWAVLIIIAIFSGAYWVVIGLILVVKRRKKKPTINFR